MNEALKVCAKTGASLEWIYRGDNFWHTLLGHVQQKIIEYDKQRQAVGLIAGRCSLHK
jgi:hypothetical protein